MPTSYLSHLFTRPARLARWQSPVFCLKEGSPSPLPPRLCSTLSGFQATGLAGFCLPNGHLSAPPHRPWICSLMMGIWSLSLFPKCSRGRDNSAYPAGAPPSHHQPIPFPSQPRPPRDPATSGKQDRCPSGALCCLPAGTPSDCQHSVLVDGGGVEETRRKRTPGGAVGAECPTGKGGVKGQEPRAHPFPPRGCSFSSHQKETLTPVD